MKEALFIVYRILLWITVFYVLYHAVLCFVGVFFRKQNYKIAADKESFCIFVLFRNEGKEVGATVENLSRLNYHPALYDVFFIDDNSTDNTSKEIKKAIVRYNCQNFYVLERNASDSDKKKEFHAVRWAISQLEICDGFYSRYDFMMILNADDFTDENILLHINSQFLSYKENKRPAAIQARLYCKNKHGIVAKGNFNGHKVTNGFWQLPRHKLGLVPTIEETGYAVTTGFLKETGGFGFTSAAEALEMQTVATIKNKKIAYNDNAGVCIESPAKVKQTVKQKIRRVQGRRQLFFRFIPVLLLRLFNPKTIKGIFRKIDMIICLTARLFVPCGVISLCMGLYFSIAEPYKTALPQVAFYINTALIALSAAMLFIAFLCGGGKEEKKNVPSEFISGLIALCFIFIIDIIAALCGLFKRRDKKHGKTLIKTERAKNKIKGNYCNEETTR